MTDDELKAIRARADSAMLGDRFLVAEVMYGKTSIAAAFADRKQLLDEVERLRAEVERVNRLHSEAEARVECRNEMRAETARLRAELEFYADDANYVDDVPGTRRMGRTLHGADVPTFDADHGKRARAALGRK